MVKNPDTRNLKYLIPEGMDGNRSSVIFQSRSPKRKYHRNSRSIDPFGQKNSSNESLLSYLKQKKENIYEAGISYRFKLNDMSKYSQTLRFKDMNFKFQRSALGKIVPLDEERRKRLAKASYLNRLYKLLKKTDWQ